MNNLDKEVFGIIDKIYPIYKEDSPEYFIQSILDKMVMKTSDKYPNRLFYCVDCEPSVDDKVYFEMHKDIHKRKFEQLFCRYRDFWEVLEEKYFLKKYDIQTLIKSLLEQHLKCEVGTLRAQYFRKWVDVQYLKQEVIKTK